MNVEKIKKGGIFSPVVTPFRDDLSHFCTIRGGILLRNYSLGYKWRLGQSDECGALTLVVGKLNRKFAIAK